MVPLGGVELLGPQSLPKSGPILTPQYISLLSLSLKVNVFLKNLLYTDLSLSHEEYPNGT